MLVEITPNSGDSSHPFPVKNPVIWWRPSPSSSSKFSFNSYLSINDIAPSFRLFVFVVTDMRHPSWISLGVWFELFLQLTEQQVPQFLNCLRFLNILSLTPSFRRYCDNDFFNYFFSIVYVFLYLCNSCYFYPLYHCKWCHLFAWSILCAYYGSMLIVAQVAKSVRKLSEYYLVPGVIEVNLTQNQFIKIPIQNINHSFSSND